MIKSLLQTQLRFLDGHQRGMGLKRVIEVSGPKTEKNSNEHKLMKKANKHRLSPK